MNGYNALVRPDSDQVMSIVTTAYVPADNDEVADAAVSMAHRIDPQARLVAAASFGRTNERTLFVIRVTRDENEALCLLAYNSHGGEGAVRFQVVEASRSMCTIFVTSSTNSASAVPHVGKVRESLKRAGKHSSLLERYLSEVPPLWGRLADTLWSPRHTRALIQELWGETPTLRPKTSEGRDLEPNESVFRHPGNVLPSRMDRCDDAANAFRLLCDFIDNESDACERGDFTKDRDERLALGAGNKLKQRAWRWIIDNTM
ncbi:DUF932 domain-containing protein [Terracoccus luteus]|uniref:DUF932 domain-containing protein n=1 Tax=Terracoccus luteus TaxID=53356 RepID=UPI001472EFF3|nr:DUF932 domain-containing protein [Terracoccus luteus]